MSSSVFPASDHPACEPAKLIVQVVGKAHPDTQKLVICDEHGKPQNALTAKDKEEILEDQAFSSVLHTWDWEGMEPHTLWLEIAAESGASIRVPLFADLQATPRQDKGEAQWNQIAPIVPMTMLQGGKNIADRGTPVLVRQGYIYIFYAGKLWRELEVRSEPDGTTFHDIDVASYREGEGFRKDKRVVTGVALQEIWLPAQYEGNAVGRLHLFYSEIQLSAARLMRYENDPQLLSKRSRGTGCGKMSQTVFEGFLERDDGRRMLEIYSRLNFKTITGDTSDISPSFLHRAVNAINASLFPAAVAAPQRAREPGAELMLDQPGLLLCDLAGNYLSDAKALAKSFARACNQGTPPDEADSHLELEALAHVLEQELESFANDSGDLPDIETAEPSTTGFWAVQEQVQDVLTDARTRQICAIVLDDEMFRMRYTQSRIAGHKALIETCCKRAAHYPHYGSAMLLQQLVVPANIGGQQNKLRKALDKASENGRRNIGCFTLLYERAEAWRGYIFTQNALTSCMDHKQSQQVLADHLSLDGEAYLAEMRFSARLFADLALLPEHIDPLAPDGQLADITSGAPLITRFPGPSQGQKLILAAATDASHPLHYFYWPVACSLEELEEPVQPTLPEPNPGDGAFRGGELAQFEQRNITKGPFETLNGELMSSLASSGSLANALTVSMKTGASVLNEIFESLSLAIDMARTAEKSANQSLHTAQRDLTDTQQRNAAAKQRRAQAGQELDRAEGEERRAAKAERQAEENARRRTGRATYEVQQEQGIRREIGRHSHYADMDLYSHRVQHMRALLPNTMPVQFIRRNKALQKDFYIFAYSDIPVDANAPTLRMYGEFLAPDGKPLASTNKRNIRGSQPLGDHRVVVLPDKHETTALIRGLNAKAMQVLQRQRSAQMAAAQQQQAQQRARRARSQSANARNRYNVAHNEVLTTANTAHRQGQALRQAQSDLQSTVQRVNTLESNLLYRALNHNIFPLSILMLECWNLSLESSTPNTFARKTAGLVNTSLETLLAGELLISKIQGNQSALEHWSSKTRVTLSRIKVERFLGKTLASYFIKEFSLRTIFRLIASLAMLVVSIMDFTNAWSRNDDAKWGYGLMLIGTGGLFASNLFNIPLIMGLAATTWLALACLVIGAGLVWWLSSTDLEDWLANGPFSDNISAPLDTASSAFYRLISLFSDIQVKCEINPYYKQVEVPYSVSQARHRILIKSNLSGLIGDLGSLNTYYECRVRSYVAQPNLPMASPKTSDLTGEPVAWVRQPDGLELYMDTPTVPAVRLGAGQTLTRQDWTVRVQLSLIDHRGRFFYFPAPIPKDTTEYGPEYAEASFTQNNRPFWADNLLR